MIRLLSWMCWMIAASLSVWAVPTIDPIGNVSIPAGKSFILPITANSPNGRALTYTASNSTNRITVEIHTNNPFWKISVAQIAPANAPGAYQTPFRGSTVTVTNIGDMTFMLLRDVAPHTIDVFQGLSASGFYNSNTIFHRVISGFMIQGGDPLTNGTGGPVFRYDGEFFPRAIFSGNGQLALANSGKDTDGSQFFITSGPQRFLDFGYTIFGQLLRGFDVLTKIIGTQTDTNNRPLADVIITKASFVPNYTDTVITLSGTNLASVSGVITIIADDGAGGRATNNFTATTVSDTANNDQPFIYPNTVTNLFSPLNLPLTNIVSMTNLQGSQVYWFDYWLDSNSTNSTINATNGQLVVRANANFTGSTSHVIVISTNSQWSLYNYWALPLPPYDLQRYTFTFGDTPISGIPTNFIAQPFSSFSNQLVALFTNGVPNSPTNNFTASINWGDNVITSGLITSNLSGWKEVRGSHTYTNSGTYPIYITIQSTVGASATVVSTAHVPPTVNFTRSGTNNVIRWPAWATDYQLQTAPDIGALNWSLVTSPSILIGYENVVSNTTASTNAFFRLKR